MPGFRSGYFDDRTIEIFADMRREQHRTTETVAFAVLTSAGLAVTAGAVVLGLVVMLSK